MKPLSAVEFLERVLHEVPEVNDRLRSQLVALVDAVGRNRPAAIRKAFESTDEQNNGS
jgi:hypothetical protein